MGDIEIWEMAEPLLYLGRNVKANSGGYGKYRGGCGFETLRMVWNAQDWTMFFMGNGYMNSDWGMMGGYPSATGYRFEAHNTGLKERIAIGDSLPLGGDLDPVAPDYERHLDATAVVKRDKQCITTEDCYDNHDLYLNYLRGGPASATRSTASQGHRERPQPEVPAAGIRAEGLWRGVHQDAKGVLSSMRPRPRPAVPKSARSAWPVPCRPANG
jgi:acetone carboxylase alpha subunit